MENPGAEWKKPREGRRSNTLSNFYVYVNKQNLQTQLSDLKKKVTLHRLTFPVSLETKLYEYHLGHLCPFTEQAGL